jgi:hypothetical protein
MIIFYLNFFDIFLYCEQMHQGKRAQDAYSSGFRPIMDPQLVGWCPLAAMNELPSIVEHCLSKSA